MAEIFGNSTPEEEMVSWLHYHLEEDDRDYCCGIFGDKAESILDFARVEDEREKEIAANRAEEALALGAGRAAGILPQTGGEVFQEVKTSQNAAAAKHGLPPRPRPVSSTVPSQLQSQQQQPLSKVFQSFYQPVAFPKANIHSSPGSKYPELPVRDVMSTISTTSTASAITVMETSASESSSTVIYVSEAGNKKCVPSQCKNAQKAAEKALERNESWSCSNASDHSACKSVNPELDSPRGNECSNLLNVNRKVDVQIPCKPSVTSSSGGSLSSPAKEAESGKKRKQADMDEMECESEEAQEFSGDTSKQPSTQTHFIKRSRAAQVHNLSEKRRRSRINEKMKALQDLIPNSNKTDKASMLDEAIEYLKQLQLQVQLLSMRNGMTVSPMYVPVVPYMQMPQMCIGMSMGHAGMHMGMGMGMGMGLMDMSQGGSGQPMLDLANPVPGQLHPMVMPNMSTTATDAHGSVQTSCGTDSSQVDLPYPQLPAASQDIYSPYLLPQQPTHLNHSDNNPTGKKGKNDESKVEISFSFPLLGDQGGCGNTFAWKDTSLRVYELSFES